ncbi:lipid IV(A) 3-deoxy-D-manno-octulosonic acid transferase [Pseudoalteromonas mariniglutinosa]|uniref:lipid IV(A) 3-deoxy-D-manno-octulosonic acid transferase n=1 Tax=Pseudoalteromonas mariniglutinosa TaxID=206042 RepID=UPI00384BAEB3
MARILYSVILYLFSPVIVFYLYIVRGKKNPAYRAHFAERFGFIDPQTTTPLVIHCASVGEVLAATPLIKALQIQQPQLAIMITCNTPTGRAQINSSFKGTVKSAYLPLDFPDATARFLKRVKPCLIGILETELWPNLIVQSNKKNIPVLVLNARLSAKSQHGYQRVQPLTNAIMSSITALASHNETDAKRFIELGLAQSKISVSGSIKFDINPTSEQRNKVSALKKYYNEQRFIWVAGSTHPVEHQFILTAHAILLRTRPEALLVIAPRHPEQFAKVAELLENSSMTFSRRSHNNYENENVLLVDTLGELQCLYGMANISYVGGSLIARGGHNPLESAAFSVGILAGPYTYNFAHIYPELITLGGCETVNNDKQLAEKLVYYSNNQTACITLGQQAAQCVANNQGAIAKTIQLINQHLEQNNEQP